MLERRVFHLTKISVHESIEIQPGGYVAISRVWLTYLVVALLLLGIDVIYLKWREHSLEPLSASIDLSRSGAHTFVVDGFYPSRYHPEFRLRLPFATGTPWFSDQGYEQLWSGAPPRVRIEVRDRRGHLLLSDESVLTRSEGWAVTGALGASEVEVYKSAELEACMFCSYTISLRVLTGTPAAASYAPSFEIAAIKAYALLPSVLGFVLLVAVLMIAGIVIVSSSASLLGTPRAVPVRT